MADITIAAILRDGVFSPNHIANDAAILHDTASELRRKGFAVNIYSESQFVEAEIFEDIVISMGRRRATVEKLQRMEDDGRIVVNSGYGVENCIRMFMAPALKKNGVPTPENMIVETDVDVRRKIRKAGYESAWVKIADDHMHHLEDITRCRHPEEVQEILHEFFFRKIRKAEVSKAVDGRRIRFYGVRSLGWVHSFMPYDDSFDGNPESDDPLAVRVRDICMRAADTLHVDIFGGDIVVSDADGACLLVSFDDWPSFAPIRRQAAKSIAKSVLARARKLIAQRKRS